MRVSNVGQMRSTVMQRNEMAKDLFGVKGGDNEVGCMGHLQHLKVGHIAPSQAELLRVLSI